jgi:hypothetical protein
MKDTWGPRLIAIAVVIAAYLLAHAYGTKGKTPDTITVTGLGEKNFSSDLVVWSANFEEEDIDLKTAYAKLENARKMVKEYLLSKGVKDTEIVFESVNTTVKKKYIKNDYGNLVQDDNSFDGYKLSQSVVIESKNVNQIEVVAREVTELLNKGVKLQSFSPRYYYTKLADLKVELLSSAADDARIRAEKIADKSGEKLGGLKESSMGVFQITGQNSDEEYSWGGAFNTSSKQKSATITVKSEFYIK